jgi:hypothetical protein
MSRFIITFVLFNIGIISYSQQEQEILIKVVQSYNKELPKLETDVFKALWKYNKSSKKLKKSEFKDYHLIIIPMFKLKVIYNQYNNSDTDIFIKYIDFTKMHKEFDVCVFKDSIFMGFIYINIKKYKHRDFLSTYFSLNDTNKYAQNWSIKGYKIFADQIEDFKPDLVFYPECYDYMCFIKDGKFFIGGATKQWHTLDYILPFDEFVKKYPLFINRIQGEQIIDINNDYIELK